MSKRKKDGKQGIVADVEKLIRLFEKSDLVVIEVAANGQKIRLTKISSGLNQLANAKKNKPGSLAKNNSPKQLLTETIEIKSTMVGIIYLTPKEGESPYLNLGMEIKKGQTIFRIDTMGLSNEFAAESDGLVTKIFVEDGQVVEYDQPLIEIQTI